MRFVLLVAIALFASTACEAGMLVTGHGSFDDTAPTTDLIAPNATWQFSFGLPVPLDANPTSSITDFVYLLDGGAVSVVPTNVEFYSAADGGGFDLNFADPEPPISLFGDAFISGLDLIPGTYAVQNELHGAFFGTGTVTLTAVPEPSTIVSAILCAIVMVGVSLGSRINIL